MNSPAVDLHAIIAELDSGRTRVNQLPDPVAQALSGRLGLDLAAVQVLFDDRAARERKAPTPGRPAPDFDLELITADGVRSGQRVRLSDHRDKPVALIFGSYT